MSAINSGGSLDVNALVSQLMSAEREPYAARFNRLEAVAKAKISAFASLSSAFDSLDRALTTLKSSSTFGGRTASSSNEDVFTAAATSAVGLGSYSVEVEALASAHKLISAGLDADTGLGAGQLSITVGETSFTVDIEAGDDTPDEIRTAINSAATAAGAKLNATLVSADDGERLVLTSTKPGSDYAISVTNSSSPANAGLDALVYDPGVLESLTEQAGANDARVYVDGVLKTSSSNTITDFVPGLTLNLKAAADDEIQTLTLSADNSKTRTAVQSLVTAFNAAVTAVNNSTRYKADTNAPSTLTGDGTARSAGNQLRTTLGQALSDLADAGFPSSVIGLRTNTDGTLVFDGSDFDAALASDPSGVQEALAGSSGFAATLGTVVSGFIGSDGIFTNRTEQLNSQLRSVADQRQAAERRLSAIEDRYRKQFTALDVMMSQAQSTSNFLAQQLAGLSNSR